MGVDPSEAKNVRFTVRVSPLITLLMVFPNLAMISSYKKSGDGEALELLDALGDSDALGERDALGLTEAEVELDGLNDELGLIEALGEIEVDELGEIEAEGDSDADVLTSA